MREFLNRLTAFFQKAARDRDLDAELETHLHMAADELIASGISPKRSSKAGASSIRRTGSSKGTASGNTVSALSRALAARPPLCASGNAERAGLHNLCPSDCGSGHRGKYHCVQLSEYCSGAPAALPGSRTFGVAGKRQTRRRVIGTDTPGIAVPVVQRTKSLVL